MLVVIGVFFCEIFHRTLGGSTCFLSISINLSLSILRRFLSTHMFILSTACAQVTEISTDRCYLMEIYFAIRNLQSK